jgi:hypothetical protein
VLLVGNVVPLLSPGTLGAACARIADHLAPDGLLVCGFGTDAAHLPRGCPVTDVDTFVAAAAAAGLVERERWGTWTGGPWHPGDGYLVTVLARSG